MIKEKEIHNPLPPCPDSPNCCRETHTFDLSPEKLFHPLAGILEKEAWSRKVLNRSEDRIEVHAVYRIPVFGWKDDVDIILEGDEECCRMFIRSASRIGNSDLGVNRRRVARIVKKLTAKTN